MFEHGICFDFWTVSWQLKLTLFSIRYLNSQSQLLFWFPRWTKTTFQQNWICKNFNRIWWLKMASWQIEHFKTNGFPQLTKQKLAMMLSARSKIMSNDQNFKSQKLNRGGKYNSTIFKLTNCFSLTTHRTILGCFERNNFLVFPLLLSATERENDGRCSCCSLFIMSTKGQIYELVQYHRELSTRLRSGNCGVKHSRCPNKLWAAHSEVYFATPLKSRWLKTTHIFHFESCSNLRNLPPLCTRW